jgi:signal peptidase I
MGTSPPPPPDTATGPWQDVRRQLRSLLVWLLVALLLRWALIEPRWIPSGSMLPSLQLQDRILVEKLGARLGRTPPAGAIVVFRPPPALLAAGYDPDAALIKRVVAGPGDRVEVRDGILWRNGTPLGQEWRREPMGYALPAFTIPAGHLMVLGDNRNASLDSHVWGPLPLDRVVGTAVWRYWPLSRFGPIRSSSPSQPGRPGKLG